MLTARREVLWVAAIGLAGAALAVTSMARKAIIYDETSHITAGYTYLKTGDYRMTPDHPPLAEWLAGLALLPEPIQMPDLDSWAWEMGDYWYFGRQLLHQPNDIDRILFRARLPMVGLMIVGGWVVWWWSRHLFGPAGGLVSLVLYTFSPTILAHGRFVTTDMAVAVFFTLTLLSIVRVLQGVTLGRWLWLAGATTALFLTKFSAPLILVPVFVLSAIRLASNAAWPWRWSHRRRVELNTRFKRLVGLAVLWVGVALPAWIGMWAVFGFRYAAALDPPGIDYDHMLDVGGVLDGRNQYPPDVRKTLGDQYVEGVDIWDRMLEDGGFVATAIASMRQHRLLPEAYLYGLAFNLKWTQSSPAFLMGQISDAGWWYYFPVCFAVKSSEITLLAVLATPFVWAVWWRSRWRHSDEAKTDDDHDDTRAFRRWSAGAIGLLLVVYVTMLIRSHFNIGHRHLLPIYPLLFILTGVLGAALTSSRKIGRTACALLLMACVLRAGAAWPNYLPFFNAFAGGSRQGYHWLGDSNVDWGQDLKVAAQYVKSHPEKIPHLIYWGTGWPQDYGIDSFFADAMDVELAGNGEPHPPAPFTPGEYLVSATAYQGIYMSSAARIGNDQRDAEFARSGNVLKSAGLSPDQKKTVAQVRRQLLFERLLRKLRTSEPIDQIGYSVLIFRLTQEDLLSIGWDPAIDN